MKMILLIQDSLVVAKEIINEGIESPSTDINWWFWIAIAELGVIVYLILKSTINKKDSLKQKLKKESLSQDIDFDNIIDSSFNSSKIYDELKIRCHPDRFPNDLEKNKIANELFQKISRNKNNKKKLLELKEEAKEKLNVNL